MRLLLITIFSFIFGFQFLAFTETKSVIAQDQLEINCKRDQPAPPCAIVIFGATGDLTGRKLLPAIYQLALGGHLSENIAVVGFARGENTHETFRSKMGEAIDQFSRTKPRRLDFWNQFQERIFYHRSEFENDEGYEKLKEFLAQLDEKLGTQGNRIYYLATQPSYFPTVISQLKKHHLIAEENNSEGPWTRVVIEKPFGNDVDSAIQLQQQISQSLGEHQIYRMDHYLGKEGVQNLLKLRFESAFFEPLWSRHHIDHVQITLAEDIGIGTRARLWEETGALRDLLQNHLMQLLAITAMEPPATLCPESIHEEKIRLLESIRPFPYWAIDDFVVRGQYGSGIVKGTKVLGYREEKGVSPSSMAETYVAMKLFIDNERWHGVPFYIRGGKRLAKQTAEIAITFKKNPLTQSQHQNVLFVRIQPNAGVFLKTISKVPGLKDELKPVVFGYKLDGLSRFASPEAYEKILFDAIQGDDQLFVKGEEQIAAWRLLTPVLDYWKSNQGNCCPIYESGTWGPKEADERLLDEGHQWQLLQE